MNPLDIEDEEERPADRPALFSFGAEIHLTVQDDRILFRGFSLEGFIIPAIYLKRQTGEPISAIKEALVFARLKADSETLLNLVRDLRPFANIPLSNLCPEQLFDVVLKVSIRESKLPICPEYVIRHSFTSKCETDSRRS